METLFGEHISAIEQDAAVRRQVMRAFVIPAVAHYFLTRNLIGRFVLPEYFEAPARRSAAPLLTRPAPGYGRQHG